jgi:uncharacterized membrane protein YqjE
MEGENKKELDKVERLALHVIQCAETRFDLTAINVQDKMAEVLASIASIAVLGILIAFVVLLLSIGTAMYLSGYLESNFLGFFYVALFYLLLAVLIYFTRKKLIKLPIINGLLKKINFHEED